jgi:hypothetical protein
MSKMTQRRLSRRAARKVAEANKRTIAAEKRISWLSSNLQSAFNAIKSQRQRLQLLTGTPAPQKITTAIVNETLAAAADTVPAAASVG